MLYDICNPQNKFALIKIQRKLSREGSNKLDTKSGNQNEQALSYVFELLAKEEKSASKLICEIHSLQEEIENFKGAKKVKEERKDPHYSLFSPISYNTSGFGDEQIEKSLMLCKKKKEELEQEYLEKKKNIECFSMIKEAILGLCSKELNNEVISNRKQNDMGIRILETQEMERSRIARDLHDSTIQNLTNLVHKTELCSRLLEVDILRAKMEILTMSNTLKGIINDMRDIIYNLRPMSINDLGLQVTVERLLTVIKENHSIQTMLKVEGEEREISPVIKLTLFRIIQEACNNIIKHAQAHTILVTLFYEDEGITIEISDDGNGFSFDFSAELKEGHHLGLSIMKERIFLLSGEFNIETKEGKGTKILIKVPLDADKEEADEYESD